MEDEGRQKKVEAGRVKFAAYLKKKNASDQQSDQKEKKKIENDTETSKEVSVGRESLDSSSLASSLEDMEGIKLEISARTNDTTATLDESKQSVEDGGEVSSERLQTRLKQLEDVLSGKEATLEAALEELNALREITSFDVSTGMLESDYKIRFEECHKRLLEFQEAVEHREEIISQLSSSLQQAIQSRDALQLQGDQLAQEVALLQRQLKATTELIQGHHWDTGIKPHDYLTLQNQVLALEVAASKNESVISDLNSIIKENATELQCKSDDLEKKSQELSLHKTKSANEIQKLMREVEELHQKCAVIASNKNSLLLEHERQMAALQSELEENFGLQLVQIKEELRNQFNEEKEALERRHVEEMAFCQTLAAQSSTAAEEPTTSSNHQLHSLHLQLQESSEAREKLMKEMTELKQSYILEVESFKQKIVVLQEQMEAVAKEKEICEQQVSESRNNFEKELAVYKQQIGNLNLQLQETKYSEELHDCKKAFEAELSSYKQSHEMELSLYKEQVDNLNLQLQEASKTGAKYLSELIESKKAYEAEIMSYQQSHEMELASYKQRSNALNLRLQEASETEENFPKVLAAHKQSLEAEVCRYKEEHEALNGELQRILHNEDNLRKEKAELLESHSFTVLSYEEQLATLKLALQAAEKTVTNHERELSSLKKRFEDTLNVNESYMNEVKNYKEQIVTLNTQLEEALKIEKTFEQDFALSKKLHEEEINLIKNKIESEYSERGAAIARCQSDEPELTLCRQQIEYLNLRLQDANEAEKCHVSEITACQVQLKEYKEQVESLDRRFSEELICAQEDFSKEINSKNHEIEVLLARLQEATALEEKYKSQTLSLQKDVENLNMQLHKRAETEKRNIMEMASCEEQRTAYSNQVQASRDELQEYKQKMEGSIESLQCEVSQLQGRHDSQLKRIEEEHLAHTASFSKEVDRLTVQLGEAIKANERLEKEKQMYHESYTVEVDEYKHQLDELNTQLQECRNNEEKYVTDMGDCQDQLITYRNQVELQNAKMQDDMTQIKVLQTKEVNDLKDELQYLKNIKATLEAEVVCLNEAAKHRDDATRAQLEEVTVQFLKTQSLLEAKEEIEKAYERRINDLQFDLDKANQCINQMKREFDDMQEVTVQNLKLQGLLAVKEEAGHMLIESVGEQEEALCAVKKDSEQMKHEISQLTLKVSEAEDLFKKLTFEKDDLSEKYKQLEAEREQLLLEKEMSEKKLKDLASQVHKLKTSRDVGGDVVSFGSSHLCPVAEMCVGAGGTPLECASVTGCDNSSGQAVIPLSGFGNTEGVNNSEDRGEIFESGPLKRQKGYVTNLSESGLSLCPAKWMERLIALEGEKIELAGRLETLESKLQEKELQEHLYNEENKATILRCKELEEKLLQLEGVRIERDTLLQEKNDWKSKVVGLEHENATFHELQKTLNIELVEEKVASEDRLYQGIKERLENIIDEKNFTTIENLILDFGHKAKEIVFLKERLRSQEQACQLLSEKILSLEKYKAEDAKRINLCREELARVQSELEESWKQHQATKEELGTSRKEVAMLYLQKQQLESSRNRLLQMSTSHADITPVYASSQQEMHSMLEELATEVQALKSSLEDEQGRNERLALELELVQNSGSAALHVGVTDVNSNDSSDSGMLELQHKLELILRSNTELVAEKECLLEKLRNQQQHVGKLQQAGGCEQVESWMSNLDKQQSDLMAELRAYREQHMSLAELVGSTGVLQETLFRQKQELLQKFKEKSAIEKMLENERAELKSAQLKMQMMENQMLEKDNIFQELTRQKRLLEQDLHEIEDRLRDQEDRLQTQKLTLESEIRDRDLRIRHWQLELKAKQVEVNSEKTLRGLDQQSTHSATESNQNGEQERLELFRSKLEEVHQQAVARLKLYMEEQFAVRETEQRKKYTSEVFKLQQQHKEQLMGLQQQLDSKVKELESLLNSELHSHLGISQTLVTRLKAEETAALKERQRSELEDVKNNLDEHQMEIYSVMKQKFEEYAEEQIAVALRVVQDEHDLVHQQTVSSLIMKHTEELKVLQAKLESQRQGDLLRLRQDLSKKHSDELNEVTKGLKLEISLLKQSHDGSSSRSSVQQLKQEMCMEYTSTLKGWVQTWYSDCQEQLEALNNQISDMWQQEESVCQEADADIPAKASVAQIDIKRLLECKEQLLTQAEVLHTEVAKHHMQALHSLQLQLDAEHAKLVQKVEQMKRTVQEGTTIASLQDQISRLAADKEELQNKHKLAVDLLAHEHDVEVAKLRDIIANVKCGNIPGLTELRQEMETKHAKEMEELRQYFEQKCADVEKHYSEEVFNQHSRKLSGSSSGLENEELVSDMYYAGGDGSQRLTALTHICDSYTVEPSFKDLEEHYQTDFEKRLLEYRDQLETVKLELEEKYQNEMEVLREEYESKVEDLVRDLSNTHKTEIQNIESKHAKEIQNLKEKLQLESAKVENTVHLECAEEVEKVRTEMADEHRKELERLKDMYEDELKKQIEHLTYSMKQGEEEHVATTKSELLSKHVRDIQKLEDSFVDHVADQTGRASIDTVLQKVDLEHKIHTDVRQQCEEEYQKKLAELRNEMQEVHAKELETKIEAERKLIAEQFDELTNILKKSAEEEQDKFMATQNEMMLDFVKRHQQDLQALKIQHEASLQAVQEECQCEVHVQQLKDKHKQETGALQEEIARLTGEKDGCTVQVVNMAAVGVSTDQTDGDEELDTTTVREMTALHTIQQLRDELRDKDAKFASAISEMKEMHETELQQVRAHCEGRLHAEVEQAKHDIARALEEEIQALLSNKSEDTPRPRELIELQEKFTVQYKQELSVLKEEHAKEVAGLRKDYETELESLANKYSQEVAALEGQMATETTQHELEKTKLAMQIKLGDISAQGTENAISVLSTDLEQLIRERDCLRKMTGTLRYLLRELVAYFTVCEDELNNTLIGELLKFEPEASKNSRELSKDNTEMNDQTFSSVPDNACNKSDDNTEARIDSSSIKNRETFSMESTLTSPQGNKLLMPQDQVICDEASVASHNLDQSLVPLTQRSSSSAHGTRRVHFAPDASSIITLIEEDNLLDYIEGNRDLSVDFRSELDNCLGRLKAEAVAILGLSGAVPKAAQITSDAVMLLEEKVNILTNRLDVEVKEKDELLKQLENVEVKERECVLLQEQVAKLETMQDGLESDLRAARTRATELERELGKREDITEGFGESIEPRLVRRLHNMAQLQDKARSVLSERVFGDHKSPHLKLIEELCQEGDRLSEEARKERDDLQQQVEAADKQLRATRLFLEEQAAEREQERDDFLREITKLQEQIRERDHDRSERERLTKEVESLELQVKEAASEQKDFDRKKEELETELKAAVDKIWVLRDIIGDLESQVETRTQREASLEQQLHQLHSLLEQQGRTHQELTDELDSLRLESGKSELTEHISHLEEQLRKHRLHVEQFQSDSTAVRQMKAQLRDLEATVDKKTKELESFHATVSSASCSSPSEDVSIREQLDAFRSDTPEEARSAQSPVCLPLDELHRLQDKLLRHSRAEEVALKRIRDLEMQLKGVKKNEEEVVAERDVLQERMEEQLLKISALQSRLDEQRQRADSQLKEANLELQAKVRDQEKELNRLLDTIENREQEIKELKITFEETRRVMAAQEREWHTKTADELEMIEKLTETCRKLKAEKGALKETREEVEQFSPCLELLGVVLSQKNACITSLRKEVEGLKNLLDPERQKEWEEMRHQMYTSGLRDEMRHQKGDITEVMLSPDVLYTSPRDVISGSQLDVSNRHLKAMLASKDCEIISLKEQLEERVNGDLSKLQVELDKRNQRLLAYEAQLADMPILEAKNEALKKTIEALETDKEDCKKKLDAVRSSEGQIRMDLEDALKKLQEKQNEIDLLQSHVSGKDDLLQRMSVDRQASMAQMGELQRCRSENSGLRSETAELQKELEILKQKIMELAAENHNLKDDLNRLPGTPDELAGQVRKELDILNQMDTRIMKKLDTEERGLSEDVACTCPVPSTVFSQVLSKALREGISALKVGEFSFIHQEICKAASVRIMQDSATQMGSEIMAPSKADENKLLMAARISALESEVACKQKEAQKRIYDLEASVCREKEHIHEMKGCLNQEQKRRIELQNRIELQSQSTADLEEQRDHLQKLSSYQENQLRQFVINLEEERARTCQLQDDLWKKDNAIKNLEAMMNDERQRTRDAKLKDAVLIEDLRIKLNTALDNEAKWEFQVEQMRRTQESGHWKDPLQHVRQCTQTTCSSFQTLSSYKGKLELEQERCEKLKMELRREKQKVEELEVAVEKEKQLGQQKAEIEREIIQDLKREFLTLEGQRDSLTTQLVHVREQLSLSRTETEAMERRVRVLQEADVRRQRKRLLDQEEMERNRQELHKAQSLQFFLEQKIVDLEQEVSWLKQELQERKEQVVAAELDQDTAQLRREVDELRQDIEGSRVREQQLSRELSSSPKVLSPVVEKLKNVNVMLEQHVTENAEVALTLSRLTEERQHLQARVKELEEQLSTALKAQAADETDSAHVAFATERALWTQEKAALKLALAQAEADVVHGCRTDDGADTSDRVKHLLGKYLRSESYRKALVWQKRYLLVVLGGYQESEALTVGRLAQLSGVQEAVLYQQHSVSRKKPRTRFKTAAIVVIALSRMHYLVRRWRLGHRIGSGAGLSRGISASTLSSTQSLYHGPRRRGSSTSVNSVGTPRAPLQESQGSPPSRDRPMLQRWETDFVQHRMRSTVTPLRPNDVAEYVDRFDELQRRLGLGVTKSPP